MREPTAHRQGRTPDVEPVLLEAERPAPELSQFFYRLVGGPWFWQDRLSWPDERWVEWTSRPEQHLLSCWVDGVPAGYVDLEQQGTSVEIAYFGLVTDMHGLGLGGWLLSRGIEKAWSVPGTERVWLHTCSRDGPAALSNYQSRGFEIVDTVVEMKEE